MLSITLSQVEEFFRSEDSRSPYLRLGQSFHQYFKLHTVTSEPSRSFCDKLYEADGQHARDLIDSITDHSQ